MTADSIQTAVTHIKARRYDAAQEILAHVPPESENYHEALRLIAKCAFRKCDFATAEATARRAIELGSEDYETLLILSSVLRVQLKYAEAAENYVKILASAPETIDRGPIYQMLATCFISDKNYDRAEATLREALQRLPQSALYAALAELQLRLRRPEDALQSATAAVALDDSNLQARGILNSLRRAAPLPARRSRWIPFPGHFSQFEDARRVIKSSLLRGYPKGDAFITRQTKFLTLGSCFATSLTMALQAKGMDAFTEFVGENVNSTVANLAFLNWVENGVQDENGVLMHEAYGNEVRERYLRAAQECDVFVFTLGLAPAFFDTITGRFFFMALASPASERSIITNYEMRTTTVAENVDNLRKIIAAIGRLSRKPVTTVLTVSPVPLAATSEMDSAVIADCLSKSTLRIACEEVRASDTSGRLHYWPSFEIVRWLGPYFSLHHPPVYGLEDRKTRHVSDWIVELIIELFLETYSAERSAVDEPVAVVAPVAAK